MAGRFPINISRPVIWNLVSFFIIGLVGILINLLLIKLYDSSVLGVFNQIYAIYIFLSQLAVGGVHLSVQAFIPVFVKDKDVTNRIITSGLFLAFFFSFLVCGLAFAFNKVPGFILASDGVTKGFCWVIPGLLFFSLNKILISYHNGFSRMKAYAVFQALRFIFIFTSLLGLIFFQVEPIYFAASLALGEFFLFLIVFTFSFPLFRLTFTGWKEWLVKQFVFGNKALTGNVLLDLNTRTDIFILGYFLQDAMVGIYSFAATFAEGVMQLPVVLRNNINPMLAKGLATERNAALQKKISPLIRQFYKSLGPLFLVSILFFPVVFWVFDIREFRWEIFLVFLILVVGSLAGVGFIPFQMIFNQGHKPNIQTYYIFWTFVSNVGLNLALIPWLGLYGSALGTSLSMVFQVLLLRSWTRKYFSIKL